MLLLPKNKGSKDREFLFYKNSKGAWYVDLPEWKAAKWHLAMVAGADILLESLRPPQTNKVKLKTSLEYFNGCRVLNKLYDEPMGDGAYYEYCNSEGDSEELWLCGVMTWYYGFNPQKIFYAPIAGASNNFKQQ